MYNRHMSKKFKTLSRVIDCFFAPVFYIFAATLIALEYFNGTNFVRNTFHLDYVDFYALSVALIAVIILKRMSKKFLLAHWKKIVFFLPVVVFFGSLIIFLRYFDLFLILEAEDSLIEWLQFFVIISSSLLSFLIYQNIKPKISFCQ